MAMANNWQIEVESLQAQLDPNFETYFPRHLRAELVGRVKLRLLRDHPASRFGPTVSGTYSSSTLIETGRDEIGIYRIHGFRIDAANCLVLSPFLARQESGVLSDSPYSAEDIGPPFKLGLEAYLHKRYMSQPIEGLLPNSEAIERLKEQEAEITRAWKRAKLRQRKRLEGDADWWKRGEEPPY